MTRCATAASTTGAWVFSCPWPAFGQVGVAKQIIVMDLGDREAEEGDEAGRRNPRHFVNPEIVWASEDLASYEEGCLSVPEIYDDVERRPR